MTLINAIIPTPTKISAIQKAAFLHFMETNFSTAPDGIYETLDKAFQVVEDNHYPERQVQMAYRLGALGMDHFDMKDLEGRLKDWPRVKTFITSPENNPE